MSTPPYELTGNKAGSAAEPLKSTTEKLPEKQLLEKSLIKIEKNEKLEHKEKPEKIEHKEKPEKNEHKEKPEKIEHKEKPEKTEHKEKVEHKEKIEKIEIREKFQQIEKIQILETPSKDFASEITLPGNPGDPIEGRLQQLEKTVGDLQHFITTNLRPDLSKGALKQEPDAGKTAKG